MLDICPLCGEAGDTLYHRVYACRATACAVAAAVPAWFLAEARRAAPGDRFRTTACCPHPGDLIIGPSNALVTEVEMVEEVAPEADDDDGSAMCLSATYTLTVRAGRTLFAVWRALPPRLWK